MTRNEEIEMEIRNQAIRLYPQCVALFELPLLIYSQIQKDNITRKNPYKVSENRIKKIINNMEF